MPSEIDRDGVAYNVKIDRNLGDVVYEEITYFGFFD